MARDSIRRRSARLAALAGYLTVSVAVGNSPGATKLVFHLDSYHQGYEWSDGIDEAIRATLAGHATLKTFYMDTKRQGTPTQVQKAAEAALAAIRTAQPDIIIASDDPAVKYVIVPYFKNGPTPVVFCGVNWSAEPYGLPTPQVTGMIEVSPILEALDLVRKRYPSTHRLGILTEHTLTEDTERAWLEPKYRSLGFDVTYAMVADFATWKQEFRRLSDQADVVFLPTNGAIQGWNDAEAQAFVEQNIRKPVVTVIDFMMPYAVFALTKIAQEQGQWAAETALAILSGKRPGDITVVRNRRRQAWFNPVLAEKIGFEPGPELADAKTPR
jgi:ABC-type uncharacterized transport system substrate-binding protein